jgi:hypothetical protein
MNNINKKNIDITEWVPIDMKVAEAVAKRVKAQHDPVVAKVERLADITRYHADPNGYGPGWDETLVRLKFTMSDGRDIVREYGNRIVIQAMRTPAVIGMTVKELERFAVHMEFEYRDEYEKLCAEAEDRAEYERLRKKFG